jgi:catechol 2,3-dioxygenase-like lactoylglutathione lyase family enzyme
MDEIQGIIETSIYVDDLDRAEAFYREVLGLRVVAREAGRHVFFHVGSASMLLLFNPETTARGDLLTHGAHGPGHFALGVKADDLPAWGE